MNKKQSTKRGFSSANIYPHVTSPKLLLVLILASAIGAIIGIRTITTLGVAPSTSILGVLGAIIISRIKIIKGSLFQSIHTQNLIQTSISSATFGAAICLLAPIGLPYVMGMYELIFPLFIGISVAMLWDAFLLYRMFGSPILPATGAWPMGIATAAVLTAGDQGGKRVFALAVGLVIGSVGSFFSIPMSAMGIALIGKFAAMAAFSIGLLFLALLSLMATSTQPLYFASEGVLIGAGVVAVLQIFVLIYRQTRIKPQSSTTVGGPLTRLRTSIIIGGMGYLALSVALTFMTGLHHQLTPAELFGFIIFATLSALVHEIMVGIAAMNTGWMPAFGIAMLFLILGIFLGYPVEALVVLTVFTSATGPAFADMGFDLKTGYIIRGKGADPLLEHIGRREQIYAGFIGFGIAIIAVQSLYPLLFAQGQFAPVNLAYAALIKSSALPEQKSGLTLCIAFGAGLQLCGGVKRQLGIMFATGLILANPMVGVVVAIGALGSLIAKRISPKAASAWLEPFAGGLIAADAFCNIALSAYGTFAPPSEQPLSVREQPS